MSISSLSCLLSLLLSLLQEDFGPSSPTAALTLADLLGMADVLTYLLFQSKLAGIWNQNKIRPTPLCNSFGRLYQINKATCPPPLV